MAADVFLLFLDHKSLELVELLMIARDSDCLPHETRRLRRLHFIKERVDGKRAEMLLLFLPHFLLRLRNLTGVCISNFRRQDRGSIAQKILRENLTDRVHPDSDRVYTMVKFIDILSDILPPHPSSSRRLKLASKGIRICLSKKDSRRNGTF